MSYRVASPNEYLAITGMGINGTKIAKAAWVWPFQRCMRFSVQPHDFAMNLQAMTKEKLQFLLPVVFTIGPDVNARGANSRFADPAPPSAPGSAGHDDDDASYHGAVHADQSEDRGDALMKYAMLLAESSDSKPEGRQFLEGIVKGIIEGETRVLVSSMTMEEIFTEREVFKRRIFRNIRGELSQFGLKIYNANVKELKDAPNSVYFESLSRKAHEGACNQARIDVAEAQLRGTVGEQERKGQQEREIARIGAETAVQKTKREIERAVAESELNTRQAELGRDVEIARTEAKRALESRDQELRREVEVKRGTAELERMRAADVVKATIQREANQQAADAAAYEIEADAKANFVKEQRLTDAAAYKTTTEAEAQAGADFNRVTKHADAAAYKSKVDADALKYAAVKTAEAELAKKLKEAEGLSAMADAYAKMAGAFGGPAGLLQFMMIERGTYVQLAKANAEAVRGMAPKISVWNTGPQAAAGDAGSSQGIDTMRNLYQMLPPLMTTINEQTGITLPEWQFGKMAAGTSAVQQAQQPAKTNGTK